jgi:hypothetical protein
VYVQSIGFIRAEKQCARRIAYVGPQRRIVRIDSGIRGDARFRRSDHGFGGIASGIDALFNGRAGA